VRSALLNAIKERWVLMCGVYFLSLCSMFVFTRTIIGDESHLLTAGWAAWSGRPMYREAWVNNMPGVPYIYGAVQKLFGPSFYLARFTSVALALAAFAFCVKTGRLIAEEWGARIAATLYAFNWVLANHYAAAYSPALLGFCLTASAYFLFKGDSVWYRIAAIAFADLAVCTRALMFPVTVAVNIYALLCRQKGRLPVLLVALVIPLSFYLGFIHDQANRFLFANLYWNKGVSSFPVQSQADLEHAIVALPGIGRMLAKKSADMVLRENALAQLFLYFPLAVLSVPLVYSWYRRGDISSETKIAWRDLPGAWAFIALSVGFIGFLGASMLFVGLLLPGGVPNYQTPGYPLFVILCVYAYKAMILRMRSIEADFKKLVGVTVAMAAIGYGIPNLPYFSGVRNIEGKGLTLPLDGIREVALFVKEHSAPGDEVLTDRPWFVYEAERRPHLGFWMTYYSYAPKWSTEMARRYGLVNADMIRESLENRVPRMVIRYVNENISDDPITFAVRHSADPAALRQVFDEGYERIATFPGVGKHGEGAVIYARRQEQ